MPERARNGETRRKWEERVKRINRSGTGQEAQRADGQQGLRIPPIYVECYYCIDELCLAGHARQPGFISVLANINQPANSSPTL